MNNDNYLTTNEFVNAVKGEGYLISANGADIFIRNDNWEVLVRIDSEEEFVVDFCHVGFSRLSTSDRAILFDLVANYTSTPPDEREEEKKFYLRHRWLKPSLITKNYLNYWIGRNVCWLDDNNETADVQTRFTLKEIEEIKKKFDTDLKDFKRVDVKDEN